VAWEDGYTAGTIKGEEDLTPIEEERAEEQEDADDAEAAPFKVGDKVKGKYKNGHWYNAVIVDTDGDDFILAWDDGDSADRVKRAEDLQLLQVVKPNFEVGDNVVARYQNGQWYEAKIADVDGTVYVVEWADGDPMDTVKAPFHHRRVQCQSLSPHTLPHWHPPRSRC